MSEHPNLDELWLDLVEGTLPEGEARSVRAHLEACDACRARMRKLEAAHEVSIRAGRIAAREEWAAIPPAVEAAILRAADDAARPAARRRRAWLAGGLALAAAAAVLLFVHPWQRGAGDVAWIRGTVAALTPPPGIRGRGDAVASAAEEVERRWNAGSLSARSATLRCPEGEVAVGALVDAQGGVALLATRSRGRTDVHVYRDDGTEAGAARLAGGGRADHALPPLPQRDARARIERPSCP